LASCITTFSRMFSLAYPAGPEPTGNIASFRSFSYLPILLTWLQE
jgi:hypothetical protein